MKQDKILSINNITKCFNGLRVLNDFSLYLKRGEILGLIGPNGAGKTTLFNIINGFIKTDEGDIYFNNFRIDRKKPYQISNLGISRSFQDIRIIGKLSVLDNILLVFKEQLGEKIRNVFFNKKKSFNFEQQKVQIAKSILDSSILSNLMSKLGENLSYGQQKLLSIIMTLISESELILLDEPVAGLNPKLTKEVLKFIYIKSRQEKKSIIIIEHNMEVVKKICDRVIFMDKGKMISSGTPEDIQNDPKVIDSYLE